MCVHTKTAERLHLLSLILMFTFTIWKTACLAPVPKKTAPSGTSDYTPVVITSHAAKMLEMNLLAHLGPLVKPTL